MKKLTALLSTVALMALLSGCASTAPVGGLFTDVTLPHTANDDFKSAKVGKAECKSFLALVAIGDCSVQAAAANGGIKKVSHVDWKANNILGIIGNYTTTVYGE